MTFPMPAFSPIPDAGAAPIGMSFIGSHSSTTATTALTITSAGLGAADATREIVVTISATSSVGNQNFVASVTVGGVSATPDIRSTTNQQMVWDIWRAVVPSGTTGNIVITLNGVLNMNRWVVGIYRLVDRTIADAAPFDTGSTSAAGDATANLDVQDGGAIIAVGAHNAAGTIALTGLAENYNNSPGSFLTAVGGFDTFVAAATNHAVTVDITGSTLTRVRAASYH